MYSTFAWGKSSKEAGFGPLTIERNVAGEEDVTFDLKGVHKGQGCGSGCGSGWGLT